MIRTPSVSMDFKNYSIADKIVFGSGVISKMTTNAATFPTPDITIVILTAENTALASAAQEALGGDHQKLSALHTEEKNWDDTYGTQGLYVDRIANHAEEIILLSGYKATSSETVKATNPDVPYIKSAGVIGNVAGSIGVELQSNEHTKNFLCFISTSSAPIVFNNNQFSFAGNPTVVGFSSDSHRKASFYNLPARSDVYLTVIAQNSAGSSIPSSPLALRTL